MRSLELVVFFGGVLDFEDHARCVRRPFDDLGNADYASDACARFMIAYCLSRLPHRRVSRLRADQINLPIGMLIALQLQPHPEPVNVVSHGQLLHRE